MIGSGACELGSDKLFVCEVVAREFGVHEFGVYGFDVYGFASCETVRARPSE